MSGDGFAPDWLALREPHDARAADAGLTGRLAAWASARRSGPRVLDLGAGTGSTLRRLRPLLPAGQDWTLVERDPALIAAGRETLAGVARYRPLDLQAALEVLGEAPADLLTASALLDLVTAAWLGRLAALRRRLGCALYVSLTYDGVIDWRPLDLGDAEVRDAVNRHQRTDKGFGGPALGPDATPALQRLLAEERGGTVEVSRSDWRLGPGDAAIQRALLDGYLGAASAIEPARAAAFRDWHARRLAHVEADRSGLTVGHLDLLYLPG